MYEYYYIPPTLKAIILVWMGLIIGACESMVDTRVQTNPQRYHS